MLYDWWKREIKFLMNIDIWHQGESLCRFLREKQEEDSDVLFLDTELLTTNELRWDYYKRRIWKTWKL